MKKKVRPLSYFLLIITFSSTFGMQMFGQEKFNISGGFGIFDLLNIGARYQLKQDTLQLGLSIGTADVEKAISGDLFYHFGGYSELSTRRPWYLKSGFTYIFDFEKESSDSFGLLFNLRLGRDINLSKKFGLNLELGVVYCHSRFDLYGINDTRVLPGFGIYFFYRI